MRLAFPVFCDSMVHYITTHDVVNYWVTELLVTWYLLYRPTDIATATLAIIAVFVEYLGQFLIDFNQIYRHSSVPKNTSPCIFPAF